MIVSSVTSINKNGCVIANKLLDQEMSPVVSQATISADFDLSRFQYIISHPTLLSFKIILTNVI